MASGFDPIYDPTYGELMSVIRRVRLRWRMKVALRGLVTLIVTGFAAFAVSVWGMDYFLYSERAVEVFRWLAYLTLIALGVRLLAIPLSRRVSKRQVALYVEEHEPTLKASVLSAVELGPVQQGSPADTERVSPELQRRVLEDAIERCQQSGFATRIERGALQRFSAALAGVASAGMVAVLLSPAFLQHGAMLLFTPWRAAAADNPYRLVVAPGNVTVARGSDQLISAAVLGFDPDRVELGLRPLDAAGDPDGEWQHWPMNRVGDGLDLAEPGEDGERMIGGEPATHDFIALNLRADTDYYVDASGVRSPIYRIRVKDLPYVDQIDLLYRFPGYSGLSDQTVEDGGDIAVLKGTQVRFSILPIFQVEAGRLLVEGDEPRDLSVEADRLVAAYTVDESTYYRIELMDDDGRWHRASAEYMVTALEDQPTIVRFVAPGRDVKVSMIDEVFAQVEAEDDYGVRRLNIRYAVNGGEETEVSLLDSASSSMKKVSVGHTLFLEEMDLQVGDSISYFAEAWDRSHAQPTISDIYFLEIRPFDRNYRQAEQGGAGGMGGAGGLDQTLSVQQKMIISATFRLIRDEEEYTSKELAENLKTVSLMQGRLRDQVRSLVTRMGNRGQQLLQDDDFSKIIRFLEQAGVEMAVAEKELEAERPEEALTEEKKALASLQRAESVFRSVRVSFEQGGGGGGGGNQQLSEDLADLFELELDKLRNQYETVQRGAAEQAQAEVDELMQKLRELARRQQRENERQNRLRSRSQQGGGGGGRQQDLIEETEELARRLERLAREQQRPELRETTQALRQAAEQMRRSQAGSSRSQANAGADGIAALDQLREARRLLDRNQRQQLGRDMEELQERASRVSQMQSRIEEQVGELAGQEGENGQSRSGLSARERSELIERIMERKDRLTDEVAGLEAQLNRMSQGARNDQPETARKLRESATIIRDEQLKEKIRYSKGVLAGRDPEFARLFENQIRQDIDDVTERIAEARESVGEGGGERQDRMLERTRDLVENLASMEARLRDRVEAGSRLGQRRGEEGERDGQQQDGQGQGGEQQGGEPQGGQQQGGRPADTASEAGGDAANPEGGRNRGRFSQYGSSSGGFYQPGIFPAEDLRQIDREFDQRRADLEGLRNDLRRERMDTADLDQLLQQMGDLSLLGLNRDPLALERLRNDIVEGLRQFEYRLWRELRGGAAERVYLGNSDQVPPGYRELVDEYFRKLASES
ncbi:MAG: hypothetical protein OYL92_09100 [Acidobacteriota bacterium]|nr:hypothetical protein [Acidobacteriota bacterium]MDE3265122.1 hypothetical protein [Acidobacteriota bacterium]